LKAQDAEGQHVKRYLPDLDWKELSARNRAGTPHVARHEFEVSYPRPVFAAVFGAPGR